MRNHLIAQGAAVGLGQLTNFNFDPAKPHTYCGICGDVFQDPDIDIRKKWARRHSATHTEAEHKSLKLSLRHVTPEAAYRLAAFGIISLSDLLVDTEVAHALLLSNATPVVDAEGVAE